MFKKVCEKMGGEYTEEYGLLESDVGVESFEEHEATKKWCTFKNMEGLGSNELTVFSAPNTFSIKLGDEKSELFDIWDNDVAEEHNLDKDNPPHLCFKAFFGVHIPKGKYCVETFPANGRRAIKLALETI